MFNQVNQLIATNHKLDSNDMIFLKLSFGNISNDHINKTSHNFMTFIQMEIFHKIDNIQNDYIDKISQFK